MWWSNGDSEGACDIINYMGHTGGVMEKLWLWMCLRYNFFRKCYKTYHWFSAFFWSNCLSHGTFMSFIPGLYLTVMVDISISIIYRLYLLLQWIYLLKKWSVVILIVIFSNTHFTFCSKFCLLVRKHRLSTYYQSFRLLLAISLTHNTVLLLLFCMCVIYCTFWLKKLSLVTRILKYITRELLGPNEGHSKLSSTLSS